jgi:hypothetical protein
MAEKKKHPFSHTIIEHHKDSSSTVHHVHEKHGHHDATPVREGDVKGSAGNHDQMMDHMMDHTSQANPGEAAADGGDHGVPDAQAVPAGLPGAAPGAAGV